MGDLRVIGAGYARTGTASLKSALDLLGFHCYHMFEVFNRPSDASLWLRVSNEQENRKVLFDQIFASYKATVDLPSILFWRDLLEYNPDAKVILTMRDSNSWYDSFQSTIIKAHQSMLYMFGHYLKGRMLYQMIKKMPLSQFDGCLSNRQKIIEVFEQHNADVVKYVPAERLLVYRVSEGWKPLCEFLNVPVPDDTPFPRINDREEMLVTVNKIRMHGLMAIFIVVIILFAVGLFHYC